MKTKILLLTLALGASTCLLPAQDQNQRPEKNRPPGREAGPGGAQRPGGFHLLPPRAQEHLKLTADQKKQIEALEAETKAKLEAILTPEQREQLKKMRPPYGPGRQGRPAGPGGLGAPGGEPPQHPPQE